VAAPSPLPLTIDADWRAASGPLAQRLARALAAAIAAGRLRVGERLPPERRLAAVLGISRTTVVAAYETLREAGAIASRRGSGSRVIGAPARPPAPAAPARGGLPPPPPGPCIELLGAHLPAVQPIVEEELAAAVADLRPALRHHGYLACGLPALREAIASHLTARGLPSIPDQVLVTCGAQQAIALAAALYLQPGDAVALEDPTYPGAIDALAAPRARLVGFPVLGQRQGGGLERLREVIARQAPRLIYVIPSFHNPTGVTLDGGARRDLAELAAATGTPVLEDLTLDDLSLAEPPPPPVAAAAPDAPVLTVGSLGKLVWGGLRIGWVRAAEPVIARLARLKVQADLGSSLPSQVLAVRLLARAAAIRDLRRGELRRGLATLEAALAAALPEWSWQRPPGGLSLWVRLPRGSATDLALLAPRFGVAFVAGPSCAPRGDAWDSHLRLPFVLAGDDLRAAVSRLAAAWAAYAPAAPAGGAPRLRASPAPPLDVLV
jgi:DNA-binding transcriptional MocR family regulator